MSTAAAARVNPYVGPRSFRTGETLYGRDREVLELLDLLLAERIVLLYSPSGAGKTSLIQAALVPELERRRFLVHPLIRVGFEPPTASRQTKFNRYVLSSLLSLEEVLPPRPERPLPDLAATSFEDYLNQTALASITAGAGTAAQDTRGRNEVLIFD